MHGIFVMAFSSPPSNDHAGCLGATLFGIRDQKRRELLPMPSANKSEATFCFDEKKIKNETVTYDRELFNKKKMGV